jgi:hypothetical protein
LPYKLEEGQPFRSDLIGKDDVTVVSGCNSVYNYWPNSGHLLEVYISSPSEETLEFLRTAPIEVGFLVDGEVNLIVIAYRFADNNWNVTPYQWHCYSEAARAVPPKDCSLESDKQFTVATVDTEGGKYRSIRVGLAPDFVAGLNSEIHIQISRGVPTSEYNYRVSELWQLLLDNKVGSMLKMKALI